MVDHITPKHLGGGDDEANLRAIKARKSAQHVKRRRLLILA
jgi:hypothetical protein